jgi:transposase
MSLIPQRLNVIPEETIRVAKAVFPNGNLYLKIRDEVGTVFADEDFATLFPIKGQPAQSPARLAWITILQFAEDLTDRQAANAVRSRIDWKYLLGLELTDPGFDFSILSEFRTRLVSGNVEHLIFEKLLQHVQTLGLIRAGVRQRTDSTHVLAAIREISRLESAGWNQLVRLYGMH